MSSPYGSSLPRPLLPVQTGPFQHPAADLGDEPGTFGERYCGLRRDVSVHRVRPAEEGLHAGDPAVGRRDDGLVLRAELTALRARRAGRGSSVARWLASRCSRRSTVACRAPPFRFAWYIAVSATCSTSSGSVVAAAGERDADARAHLNVDVRERERPRQRGTDARRERSALRRVVEVFAQDDELVAAQTGEGVAGAEDAGQAVGDGDQQLVTDVVTVRVVDRLELVEVGEEDRHDLVGALAAQDRVVEALHQQRAVRQAGERVVERALVRAFRRLPQIRARLGVEEVRGGDIGEGLRGHHRARVERSRQRRGTCRARRAGCRPGGAGR